MGPAARLGGDVGVAYEECCSAGDEKTVGFGKPISSEGRAQKATGPPLLCPCPLEIAVQNCEGAGASGGQPWR